MPSLPTRYAQQPRQHSGRRMAQRRPVQRRAAVLSHPTAQVSEYASKMDIDRALAIIFGITSVVLAILFYLKPRRSALIVTTDEQRLEIPSETGLTVSLGGEEIPNPRILTAQFRNTGPLDVTPGALAGGHMYLLTTAGSVLSVSASGAKVELTRTPVHDSTVLLSDRVGIARLLQVSQGFVTGVQAPIETDRIDITPDIIVAGEVITVTAVAKESTDAHHFAKLAGFTTRVPSSPASSRRTAYFAVIGMLFYTVCFSGAVILFDQSPVVASIFGMVAVLAGCGYVVGRWLLGRT